MVVGYNMYTSSRFVGYYNDPLGSSTQADGYLKDYWSMPYSAVFDENDNLYIADLNRARVLIYKKPFQSSSTKTGDLNGDNKVDTLDLSILLTDWGQTSGVADINKDGVVNILDLSILLTNWGI
jgi:hypothetical protein